MAVKKETTWNGITYPSRRDAARALGITASAMQRRLTLGYTCDDDMLDYSHHPKNIGGKGPRGTPCTWNGTPYPSVYAAAKATGVDHMTMRDWLDKGYAYDGDTPDREFEWEGVIYPTMTTASDATGIPQATLFSCKLKGYTSLDDRIQPPRPCEWNGVQYNNLAEAARTLGITREAMRLRVNKGQTCDDDLGKRRVDQKGERS